MKLVTLLRNALITACIAALFSIFFSLAVPIMLRSQTTANCRPDAVHPEFTVCDARVNVWSVVEFSSGLLALYGIPLMLGGWYAFRYHRDHNRSLKRYTIEVAAAVLIFVLMMIVIEFIRFRPWDSDPYNRYSLNSVYASPLLVLFIILPAVGFLFPAVISSYFLSSRVGKREA